MSGLADALSSAGLLLTALALIYSAWSATIESEVTRTYAVGAEARKDDRKQTHAILWLRALPLSIAGVLVLAAFMPRYAGIVANALECRRVGGCSYDDVSAVFLATGVVILVLVVYLCSRAVLLIGKLWSSRK
jgi:hypothetical protein